MGYEINATRCRFTMKALLLAAAVGLISVPLAAAAGSAEHEYVACIVGHAYTLAAPMVGYCLRSGASSHPKAPLSREEQPWH